VPGHEPPASDPAWYSNQQSRLQYWSSQGQQSVAPHQDPGWQQSDRWESDIGKARAVDARAGPAARGLVRSAATSHTATSTTGSLRSYAPVGIWDGGGTSLLCTRQGVFRSRAPAHTAMA
jgi:hypothetical protein